MTAPTTPVLPHLRLTWGGDLGSPAADQWVNGLNWRVKGEPPSADELDAITAEVKDSISSWHQYAGLNTSAAARLAWIKAVYVQSSGKQRDQNTAEYDFPANALPAGSAQAIPWHQTYAITLRSANSRGLGSAGRIFPPACGPGPEGLTPYASATFANNVAAAFVSIFTQVRNGMIRVLNPGLANNGSWDNVELAGAPRSVFLAIVSRKSVTNPTPRITDVTGVVLDRVADVQHRRTAQVPRLEGSTAALPQA